MKYFGVVLVTLIATGAMAQDSLFERNHQALERAQQRNYDPPNAGGRTGYVERGYHNNTGNDSQSGQLDRLDRE